MRAAKFWSRSEVSGDCWIWSGALDVKGYGTFRVQDTKAGWRHLVRAHRFAYFLAFGSDPAEFFVCHSCDTPACINPAHLFLGTNDDNMRDRDRKGRVASGRAHYNSRKTHCPKGHLYDEENTLRLPHGRGCRECGRIDARERQRRKRVASNA